MTASPTAVVAAAVRRERERAGLSLTELARRAGLAKSTLSQVESGQGNPGVETLWAIATALALPFSRLVDPPTTPTRVVRDGEGPVMFSEEAAYSATLLASCAPGSRHDVYRIAAEPGSVRRSQPHPVGTVEHVVLSAGRAVVGPTGTPVELAPGDYVSYSGAEPHVFEALEPGTRAVMVTEHG